MGNGKEDAETSMWRLDRNVWLRYTNSVWTLAREGPWKAALDMQGLFDDIFTKHGTEFFCLLKANGGKRYLSLYNANIFLF